MLEESDQCSGSAAFPRASKPNSTARCSLAEPETEHARVRPPATESSGAFGVTTPTPIHSRSQLAAWAPPGHEVLKANESTSRMTVTVAIERMGLRRRSPNQTLASSGSRRKAPIGSIVNDPLALLQDLTPRDHW